MCCGLGPVGMVGSGGIGVLLETDVVLELRPERGVDTSVDSSLHRAVNSRKMFTICSSIS
jgi:hypothetical protein